MTKRRWFWLRDNPIPSLDLDDDELVRLAQDNAQDNYSGPPEREPVVALLLTEIQARARRSFVEQTGLRDQQQHRAETNAARDRAEHEVDRTASDREYGSGDEAAGRRAEHRVASRRLGRAEKVDTSQEIVTRTLENQVVDEIGAKVERWLGKPRLYLTAFNGTRHSRNEETLDPLPDDIVHTIMTRIVRSPLADPRAGRDGASTPQPEASERTHHEMRSDSVHD